MAKQGNGSIVNISSVSANPELTKALGYIMGKAAIDCYTNWFAAEVAYRHGVRKIKLYPYLLSYTPLLQLCI